MSFSSPWTKDARKAFAMGVYEYGFDYNKLTPLMKPYQKDYSDPFGYGTTHEYEIYNDIVELHKSNNDDDGSSSSWSDEARMALARVVYERGWCFNTIMPLLKRYQIKAKYGDVVVYGRHNEKEIYKDIIELHNEDGASSWSDVERKALARAVYEHGRNMKKLFPLMKRYQKKYGDIFVYVRRSWKEIFKDIAVIYERNPPSWSKEASEALIKGVIEHGCENEKLYSLLKQYNIKYGDIFGYIQLHSKELVKNVVAAATEMFNDRDRKTEVNANNIRELTERYNNLAANARNDNQEGEAIGAALLEKMEKNKKRNKDRNERKRRQKKRVAESREISERTTTNEQTIVADKEVVSLRNNGDVGDAEEASVVPSSILDNDNDGSFAEERNDLAPSLPFAASGDGAIDESLSIPVPSEKGIDEEVIEEETDRRYNSCELEQVLSDLSKIEKKIESSKAAGDGVVVDDDETNGPSILAKISSKACDVAIAAAAVVSTTAVENPQQQRQQQRRRLKHFCRCCLKKPGYIFVCPCEQAYYCSKKCQRRDWVVHKTTCPISKQRRQQRRSARIGESVNSTDGTLLSSTNAVEVDNNSKAVSNIETSNCSKNIEEEKKP